MKRIDIRALDLQTRPDAVIFGYETGYWPNLHNAVIQYVESSQLVKSIMKCNQLAPGEYASRDVIALI